MTNLKAWVIVTSAKSKLIRHMTGGLEQLGHQDLKVTSTIARSMDIDPLNAYQSLCGHQTNQQRPKDMDITAIGTIILGRAITTVRIMDTFSRIALEHISMAAVING